jgi:hypothetical protein
MAEVLFEKFRNLHGVAWIRTHGTDPECFALCSYAIHPDAEGVSLGVGQITCPDCVEVIKRCKEVLDQDLAPEYGNDLFLKRVRRPE